jgi:nicotinamidase/pyrazinamidase
MSQTHRRIAMRVLILVDLLADFFPGGSLAVRDAKQVIPVANELLRERDFALRIGVKEGHTPDHVSFADSHKGKVVGDVIEVNGHEQRLWPRHGIKDTPGAQFVDGLLASEFDHVIEKGTDRMVDSYSAFFDNNGERETGLRALLEEQATARGVDKSAMTLVIGGVALDVCVKSTVLDARKLGYNVELVVDACRSLEPSKDLELLRELQSLGVAITARPSSREVTYQRPLGSREINIPV